MATAGELNNVLTRETLLQFAGARSFERGEDYFATGQGTSLVEHAGKLMATVQGAEDYRVKISNRDGALDYDCTCPMGADGVCLRTCCGWSTTFRVDEWAGQF